MAGMSTSSTKSDWPVGFDNLNLDILIGGAPTTGIGGSDGEAPGLKIPSKLNSDIPSTPKSG